MGILSEASLKEIKDDKAVGNKSPDGAKALRKQLLEGSTVKQNNMAPGRKYV